MYTDEVASAPLSHRAVLTQYQKNLRFFLFCDLKYTQSRNLNLM